ncbi:helix-turn-helix domain containing protein [Micromonospora sp. WMMD1076]|uniref:TetR/AcrR family transcriptional regulator n=1 Tax=Micromonospora sp. WMMD1076 TaxID=3016103 RepID=UPI00249B461B|nr:TetR/AcrR family transcriptional regulator [Micromonospora sp. WMMD1076]WFF08769.1 helix-turn-helix domain containing protein [Micromonospora sp. WMMD1076]
MTTTDSVPLRADARRNRERIVSAARELFAEAGAAVPMEEIARRAQVGVGTLYRRFPEREELTRAVAADYIERLAALTQAAAAEEPDAWRALRRLVRQCAAPQLGALSAALKVALPDAFIADPDLTRARLRWMAQVDELVHAAQADGALRSDIGTGDLILLISLLTCHLPELPAHLGRSLPARYLELTLDGLAAEPTARLPGVPITASDLGTASDSTRTAKCTQPRQDDR